jgi:hypothetical protein
MASVMQIELKQYFENHRREAIIQDSGVVLLTPVFFNRQFVGNEAVLVESYPQARQALGYGA